MLYKMFTAMKFEKDTYIVVLINEFHITDKGLIKNGLKFKWFYISTYKNHSAGLKTEK